MGKEALQEIEKQLEQYDYKEGLNKANAAVNHIMKEISQNFEFEESYTY
jgi:hypothetical protein